MDFNELIPAVSILAGVGFAWIGYKYRELIVTDRRKTFEAEQHSIEKTRLEERIAVLERIATDRGIDTADQIEALRDRDVEQLR